MDEYIKMQEEIKVIPLSMLPDKLEGPEPTSELIKSIQDFSMIYPIIISIDQDGKQVVVDGRRRIKACRILKLDTIKVIYYEGLEYDDEAAWALILNNQRSDNPVTEYKYYSQLAQTQDWDEIRKQYGFNKNHVQKILSLGKIKELDTFKEAYEKGLVAATTLFEVAKLGEERQDYIEKVLETKGKLALSDVKEAKRIKQKEAISVMPQLTPVAEMPKQETEIFCFAIAKSGEDVAKLYTNGEEAYKAMAEIAGSRLFKVFEI